MLRQISRIRLQYVSDVHVDMQKTIPKIKPVAKYLALCGDIGKPDHPSFCEFLAENSRNFEKIFFVPGNHDFNLGPMYLKEKVDKYEPIVKDICSKFKNIHYLNKNIYNLNEHTIISGSILWSKPVLISESSDSNYLNHIREHNDHIKWIQNMINCHQDKNIIMLTHFVPTFKLIEEKYLQMGIYRTSWFATDLEYLIRKPIKVWICGHSHSVIDCIINDVICAINAYGYYGENNITKAIDI